MKNSFVSTITKTLEPYKLPNNWKWFFWEDIMKSYQQGMIRSNSQLGEGNVEYLKMGDIDIKGTVNLDDLKRTEATSKEIKEFKLNNGDFLINVRNSLSLVGKTCIVDNIEDRQVLYNHMLVRIDNGNSDMNYFINAFLNIPSSKKLLDRIKEGTTTVIALYQRELNKLPIALPDDLLFNSVVDIYKKIRNKIEVNNKINQELEAMAKTLYDYWFVQFDFPDANGKPYKSSGGKMVFNEALKREIPEGWESGLVKELFQFNPTLSIKKGNVSSYIDMNALPVNGFMTKPLQKKAFGGGMRFQNDDVVIARITPCLENGKTALISLLDDEEIGFGSTEFIVLRGIGLKLKSFACCLSRSEKFRKHSISKMTGTSGRKRVKADALANYKMPIPPKEILENFENATAVFFDKMTANTKQNQKLSELRDWLLPMLMNGQVTVTSLRGTKKSHDVNSDASLGMVAEDNTKYGKG